MARGRLLTVEEAILLHLRDYSRYSPGGDVPGAVTQSGIAAALRVRRSHVSMSLDAARKKGRVNEIAARVRGESRKRKCYFLTQEGRDLAAEMERRLSGEPVSVLLPDGGRRSGRLGDVLDTIGSRLTLPRAALLVRNGILDLPPPEPEPPRGQGRPRVDFLAGRCSEVGAVKEFLADGRVMMIRGLPGMGKTALVAFALAGMSDDNVFWYDVNGWSSPRNMAAHLAGFLGQRCPRLRRYLEAHEIPDLGDLGDILAGLDADIVLVFDDCQNANAGARAFLGMLAYVCGPRGRGGGAKLLLISRGDLGAGVAGHIFLDASARTLDIGPLDMGACLEILARRGIGGSGAEALARQSGGHPLFLMLAGTGDSAGVGDIKTLIARTISGELDPGENRLLLALSVYREPVSADAVLEEQRDVESLEALRARGLVTDAGDLSMHGLVRDYYYETQPPDDRRKAHLAAARYYGRQRAGALSEMERTYHLLMAGAADDAADMLCGRGESWLREGYADEILHLSELLPGAGLDLGYDREYGLNHLAASALELIGDWEGAMDRYAACLRAARERSDGGGMARALAGRAGILYRQGKLQEARDLLEEALNTLPAHGDEMANLRARITGSLGVVFWRLGTLEEARNMHTLDLEMSRRIGDRRGMARALNNLGILDWQSGDAGSALEKYAEALEHAERLGDIRLVAILYSNVGDAHRLKGENAEAKRYYLRCLDIAEDLKFHWQVAEAYRGLAQIPGEDSQELLGKALRLFDRLGAAEDAKLVKEMMH